MPDKSSISVGLKKYVDLQVRMLGKLFAVQIKSLKALVAAARAEVPIALASLKDRLEGMNEFRRSMDDMGKQFQTSLASLADKYATRTSFDELDRRTRIIEQSVVSAATVKNLDDALNKLEKNSATGDTVGGIDRRVQKLEASAEGNTARAQAVAQLEANVSNLKETYVSASQFGQVDTRVQALEAQIMQLRAGKEGAKEGGAELAEMRKTVRNAVIIGVVGALVAAVLFVLKMMPR